MIADAMTINQLSWEGAHSLDVDSGAMYTCVPRVMLLTRLCNRCRNVGEDGIFDQQVARCSRFGENVRWHTML